jgi:hypothetical protein
MHIEAQQFYRQCAVKRTYWSALNVCVLALRTRYQQANLEAAKPVVHRGKLIESSSVPGHSLPMHSGAVLPYVGNGLKADVTGRRWACNAVVNR